jgi:two-component system response regulator MprA
MKAGGIRVVEDDRDVREVLADVLREAGFPVLTASDGAEALKALRDADPLPGLILLDLMMPGMDGWQFRDEQRRDARLNAVPVVVLTARPDVGLHDTAGFLRKPVRLDDLLAVASRFCRKDGP